MSSPQPLLRLLRNLQQTEQLQDLRFIVDTADGLRHLNADLVLSPPTATPILPEPPVREEAPCALTQDVARLDEIVKALGAQAGVILEEVRAIAPYYEGDPEDTLAPFQPDESVALGYDALAGGSTDRENVAIGLSAGTNLEGGGNVIVGPHAAAYTHCELLETTVLGHRAMYSHTRDVKNVTALGAYSRATGSHQVVLGDHRVNVYSHSPMHHRADPRDMAGIQALELGLDFVLDTQPIQYQQDFRETYIDWSSKPQEPEPLRPKPEAPNLPESHPEYQSSLVAYRADNTVWKKEAARYEADMLQYHNDLTQWIEDHKLARIRATGKNKGTRTHLGFNAASLLSYCTEKGLDLAMLQDHSVNDGEAVLTHAQLQMLPILWRAVQQLRAQLFDDSFADLVASKILQRHAAIAAQVTAPVSSSLPVEE